MSDSDTQDDPGRHHRIPIITALCLATALCLLLLIAFVPSSNPNGALIWGPPALGLLGCITALLDRRLESRNRGRWATWSALGGFLGVAVLLIIATLIEAIDWTVNGPPSWLGS
jgi:hypothetical protein